MVTAAYLASVAEGAAVVVVMIGQTEALLAVKLSRTVKVGDELLEVLQLGLGCAADTHVGGAPQAVDLHRLFGVV